MVTSADAATAEVCRAVVAVSVSTATATVDLSRWRPTLGWRSGLVRLALCTLANVLGERAALAVERTGLPDAASRNHACLECHGLEGSRAREPLPGTKREASTQEGRVYAASVHGKLACIQCHVEAAADPHEPRLSPVDCASCHEEQSALYLAGIHAPRLPGGNPGATCKDCHGAHDTLEDTNPESRTHPARIPDTCAACHVEVKPSGERAARSQAFEAYTDSIHYRALQKGGLVSSATCVSCHASHEVRRSDDPLSKVHRSNVPATCGACHQVPLEQYSQGIHGLALARGSFDTPVCTDCHGEHGIKSRGDRGSRVFATAVSKTTCPQCHSAVRINEKYGLEPNQVESYQHSFHGLADQFGMTTVANCASCHGAHLVLHSSNPESSVHTSNLPETCGQCHEGAGENFAAGGVHRPDSAANRQGPLFSWVRGFYVGLIGLTITGMALYNVLDYLKTIRIYRQATRQKRQYVRFVSNERRQHLLLVISFFLLVFSGFALRYPEAFWVKPLVDSELSFLVRGYTHRVAAIVFILLCAYHTYYLAFTRRGREQYKALIPGRSDAREFKQQLRYYLGMSRQPARFNRYSYVEKSEYWALIWGSFVMIVTGLILWFEQGALSIMPKWGWDLAELVHLYEAWLATLSIFVWHLYHVAFKPSLHGVSFAMVSGKLNEDEMRHEHPGELEALEREHSEGPAAGEDEPRRA